mmetsp:Transcript_2622/g.7499  ORF Transcript_2622/g.7499 Transcript_2622/m.7499 type:complete len:205 (+) Transcript_2622:1177-1791(+)
MSRTRMDSVNVRPHVRGFIKSSRWPSLILAWRAPRARLLSRMEEAVTSMSNLLRLWTRTRRCRMHMGTIMSPPCVDSFQRLPMWSSLCEACQQRLVLLLRCPRMYACGFQQSLGHHAVIRLAHLQKPVHRSVAACLSHSHEPVHHSVRQSLGECCEFVSEPLEDAGEDSIRWRTTITGCDRNRRNCLHCLSLHMRRGGCTRQGS